MFDKGPKYASAVLQIFKAYIQAGNYMFMVTCSCYMFIKALEQGVKYVQS